MGWSARVSWNFPPLVFHLFGSFVSMVWWTSSGTCPLDLRTSYDAFQVRLFAFGSLVRLACARALVSRANPRTQRFVFRFLFRFFFGGGSYRVRTVFLPCPPSRKFRWFFRFVSLFGEGRHRGNRKEKRGTNRGTPPRGEGTTRATGGILIARGRVRGVFPTLVGGGTVPRVFVYPLPRAPTGTDRRGTRRRSSQDVARVPPCGGSQLDRIVLLSFPFLSLSLSLSLTFPFLRTREGVGLSSRNAPNRMERSSERTETKARRMRRTKERKDSGSKACVAVRTHRDRCTRTRVGRRGYERIQTTRDARYGSTSSSSEKKKQKKNTRNRELVFARSRRDAFRDRSCLGVCIASCGSVSCEISCHRSSRFS